MMGRLLLIRADFSRKEMCTHHVLKDRERIALHIGATHRLCHSIATWHAFCPSRRTKNMGALFAELADWIWIYQSSSQVRYISISSVQ